MIRLGDFFPGPIGSVLTPLMSDIGRARDLCFGKALGSDRKVVQRSLEQRHVQPQSPEVITPLTGRDQSDLGQRLIQAGQALHVQVRECADNVTAANALVELAAGRVQADEGVGAWDHPLIRDLQLVTAR